jgi:hypothetical protein
MAAGLEVPQTERQKEVPVRKNGVLLEYREIHENHFGDHTKAGAFEACGPPSLPSQTRTHTHTHTQTRGSLNPIGPIAISSKWLSRELNRIGFQR